LLLHCVQHNEGHVPGRGCCCCCCLSAAPLIYHGQYGQHPHLSCLAAICRSCLPLAWALLALAETRCPSPPPSRPALCLWRALGPLLPWPLCGCRQSQHQWQGSGEFCLECSMGLHCVRPRGLLLQNLPCCADRASLEHPCSLVGAAAATINKTTFTT
jgi:hypothetical protein